jgi:hypothetical protein
MFELRCYQRLFLKSSQGEEFFLACPGPSGICFKTCLLPLFAGEDLSSPASFFNCALFNRTKKEKRPTESNQKGVFREDQSDLAYLISLWAVCLRS